MEATKPISSIPLWDHHSKNINSSPHEQNGCHFADIFKYIFMNEKFWLSIQTSLKFAPKGPVDNNKALVQVMAWHRTVDKPLPKPLLTQFTDAYMWR